MANELQRNALALRIRVDGGKLVLPVKRIDAEKNYRVYAPNDKLIGAMHRNPEAFTKAGFSTQDTEVFWKATGYEGYRATNLASTVAR